MSKKLLVFTLIFFLAFTLVGTNANAVQPDISIKGGDLIKGSGDSVYHYGSDGKRYVFPNFKTYQSWYGNDFSKVVIITDTQLAAIPIGGNVTYKPGAKLIKITSDPKVYFVDQNQNLKAIKTEAIAIILFGADWASIVEDVPVAFFVNYNVGEDIEEPKLPLIDPDISIEKEKGNAENNGQIQLKGYQENNKIILSWESTGLDISKGYKVVKSSLPDPVYPGNEYHYLTQPHQTSDTWTNLNPGTYYFRVCQYLGGSCGVYSNNLKAIVEGQTDSDPNKNIELQASVSGNTVTLNWQTNFNSAQGYKVVISETADPVYPGNDYHYITDPKQTNDKWPALNGGTYNFRVCEYLGGACGVYSNNVAVEVDDPLPITNQGLINLTGSYDASLDKVVLSWELTDLTSSKGFKIVKSTNPNPVYPGNTYHYLSDPNARADSWSGLVAGTYHFRVCEYLGGACGIYSNDLEITVTGSVVDNSNGEIDLSGYYDQSNGKVYLNWSLTDLNSPKGFKIVQSTNPNPVYPGNTYHYLSNPDTRSDYWPSLGSGSYHFRICEYLGGACGIYSNDLVITIP